tara:strand:- start:10373 stop:11302 length:930 start_codon:yes stop_codon:yes gene_type:complete
MKNHNLLSTLNLNLGSTKGMILLISIITLISASNVFAQSFTETRHETARFQNAGNVNNTLYIHNIHGDVIIKGYDGDEVQIEYHKEINADTRNDLDRAKEEIEFLIEEERDRILIYLDAPFIHVKKHDNKVSYNIRNWDDDYDFRFDIIVQVPRNTNLNVSTINNGKVTVENMRGQNVVASNVNGHVELANVTGITKAHTINGNVSASYNVSPAGNSSYQTLNGTIEVIYPEDLSADITFKSLHGDLYTDFQNVQRLETRVESDQDRRRGKTTYRIDKFAPLRIGNGGPKFSFEVLNGDVYIKQMKSNT